MADSYRVVAWDAPGYGGSADPDTASSLSWYAGRAAEAIAAASAEPVHLLGSGWGGMVAMQVVIEHPDLVRSIAIADSQLGSAGANVEGLRRAGIEGYAGERAAALVSPAAPAAVRERVRAELRNGVHEAGFAAAAGSMSNAGLAARLAAVRKPCVVIAGEDASTDAAQRSQDVCTAFPESVQVAIHGAGSLTHLERPAVFAEWLRSFLYLIDQVDGVSAEQEALR